MTVEERDAAFAAHCPLCGDSGAILAPHPHCVDLRRGVLVGFQGGPSLRRVWLRCTECPKGGAHPNYPPWERYIRAAGGLDVLGLMEDWDAERRAAALN